MRKCCTQLSGNTDQSSNERWEEGNRHRRMQSRRHPRCQSRIASRRGPCLTSRRPLLGRHVDRWLPLGFVPPCLPVKAAQPSSGGLWLHEIKHDGCRVIARKDGDRVKLYSRPGNDLTGRFPLIVEALARLRSRSCIIDGEAVACDDSGIAQFNRIRYRGYDSTVFLYAFDLIELNGDDLRRDPLQVHLPYRSGRSGAEARIERDGETSGLRRSGAREPPLKLPSRAKRLSPRPCRIQTNRPKSCTTVKGRIISLSSCERIWQCHT